MDTLPVTIPPGVVRNSTPAGVGAHWYDSHLMRWVSGRLRPILGWEEVVLRHAPGPEPQEGAPPDFYAVPGDPFFFPSPIRAVHQWTTQSGSQRVGVLCERHLFVVEGENNVLDVSPPAEVSVIPPYNTLYEAGIRGPSTSPTAGGYGGGVYDQGVYDQPRPPRDRLQTIGEVWRLGNFGDHLIAMASTDGRLLRWIPGEQYAQRVKGQVTFNEDQTKWAPEGNRTFVITSERYLILFGMGGQANKFGWCDQENIEDWNFADPLNTAGFYEVQPSSRIIDAQVARYTTIFWTVQGAYVIEYKALPYIYTFSYLGAHAGPLSGQAAAAFGAYVMWPARDGFWQFDGSAVSQVACPILDWFQQNRDDRSTRAHMAGWFNGAASEVWWSYPSKGNAENNKLIVYNFEERWWSIGDLSRTCGYPGTGSNYPFMATIDRIYRHEKGMYYPGAELPWIRSGHLSPDGGGKVRSTTKQILVDTDAPLNAVTYQIIATKGRFANAKEYMKPPKMASDRGRWGQGKIDYRITGRDFALKMQSTIAGVPWSFGQGTILLAPRGRVSADDKVP